MQAEFYVKYSSQNDYSIGHLWQSLIGLEKNIQAAVKMYWINTDVELKIKRVTEWSIIFDIFIGVVSGNLIEIFNNWLEPFLNFLLVTDKVTYNAIRQQMTEDILTWYNDLESFFANHPMTYDMAKLIVKWVIQYFAIAQVISWVTININTPLIQIDNLTITQHQAQYVKKELEKWAFNDLLVPITENEVEKIEFWVQIEDQRVQEFEISDQNFEKYFSEWKEILPNLINGQEYVLPGKITSMQVNRGESMRYNIVLWEKEYSLILLPSDWDSIDSYKMYFNQNIVINVEVVRTSLYKKPELIMKWLNNASVPLDFTPNNNTSI